MKRYGKFILGGAVIVLALGALVMTAVRQGVVYFVTPSELQAAAGQGAGKAYRLGGIVVEGSLKTDPGALRQEFLISDGKATVPVRFQGIPPDLFAEGRGAVVEGTYGADGVFQATSIMAKHSEEYRAPEDAEAGYQEILRTFQGSDRRDAAQTPQG